MKKEIQPIVESFNVDEEFMYNKSYLFIKGYASYAAFAAVCVCSEACCFVLRKHNTVNKTAEIVEMVVAEKRCKHSANLFPAFKLSAVNIG